MIRFVARALEFGHNQGIRRWVAGLLPFAERWWFPPLAAVMAALATLSFTIPVGPVLIALVALDPRRWRAVVIWAVLGSAVTGTLVTHLLGHFGMEWIDRQLPQVAASRHWHYLVGWAADRSRQCLARRPAPHGEFEAIADLPLRLRAVIDPYDVLGVSHAGAACGVGAGRAARDQHAIGWQGHTRAHAVSASDRYGTRIDHARPISSPTAAWCANSQRQ